MLPGLYLGYQTVDVMLCQSYFVLVYVKVEHKLKWN